MAGGKLQWTLELLNRSSGPAGKINEALSKVEAKMKALDKLAATAKTPKMLDKIAYQRVGLELERTKLRMDGLKRATESFVSRLDHGLNLIGRFGRVAAGAVRSIGRATTGFARFALDHAAGKEAEVASFAPMLGGRKSAGEFVGRIDRISDLTSFEDGKLQAAARSLLGAGYSRTDVPALIESLANAGASTGFDPGKLDSAVEGLRKFALTGKWTDKIATTMNAAGFSAGASKGGLRALVEEGLVGRSGAAQTATESTLRGLMTSTRKSINGLFESLWDSNAFDPLRGMMKNFGHSLRGSGGDALRGSIDRTLKRLFESAFGGGSSVGALDKALAKVGRGLEIGGTAIGAAWQGFMGTAFNGLDKLLNGPLDDKKLGQIEKSFENLGEKVGGVVSSVAKLLGYLDKLMSFGDFGSTEKGASELDGFGARYKALRLDRMGKADSALGGAAGFFNPFTQAADGWKAAISSPEEIERQLAGGRGALPVASGTPFNSMAWRMGGGMTGQATVIVNAPGATKEDADAIASKAKAATQDGVATALSKAATSRGAI